MNKSSDAIRSVGCCSDNCRERDSRSLKSLRPSDTSKEARASLPNENNFLLKTNIHLL